MCACGLCRAEPGDGHVRWQLIESETKFKNAGHQELYGEVGEREGKPILYSKVTSVNQNLPSQFCPGSRFLRLNAHYPPAALVVAEVIARIARVPNYNLVSLISF